MNNEREKEMVKKPTRITKKWTENKIALSSSFFSFLSLSVCHSRTHTHTKYKREREHSFEENNWDMGDS